MNQEVKTEVKTEIVEEKILSTDYEIIIGCAPFRERPDAMLALVLKDTILCLDDFEITSKLYGDWIFIPFKEKENIYFENRIEIGEKLKKLYSTGQIRCAGW
jgi:hypothetical protein